MRYTLALIFLIAGLILTLPGAHLGQESTEPPQFSTHPKLHFRLQDLVNQGAASVPQKTGLVRIDEFGRVQVYIRPVPGTQVQGLLDQITALGGKIDGQGLGVIQAWIPIDALESLADRSEVRYIRPPDYGRSNTGSVTTQGDAILGLDDVRQQFGIDGSGVRVGVISTGLKGLEQSIASGDLPPTTFHCQDFFLTIRLRPNGPCLSGERLVETSGGITGRPFPSGGDLAPDGEGTAMLEIIHDLAPGAELWFANPITTLDLFTAAIFLAFNVDVLVSDIGIPGFFPDGQNTFSQALAQIIDSTTNRARAYIQSAGNHSLDHYSGTYTDSGFGNINGNVHLFSANSETTGPATPSHLNQIIVPAGVRADVFLTWNDPAGASTNNYDLLFINCNDDSFLAASNQIQNGFQEPLEGLSFNNVLSFDVTLCYAIQNFGNLAAPRTLNILLGTSLAQQTGSLSHLFNTVPKSIVVPADTLGDLIAVGAVPQSSPNVIEPFSSRGPTFDGRTKPDVVATDGVRVTGSGGFSSPFFGTSAAAPHVAGLAALLLELDPTLTLSGLKFVLKQSATPLGGGNTFGAGRINGLVAAQAVSPVLSVSPGGIVDFGSVTVGQSADRSFTVTNTGEGTLTGSASTSLPYSIVDSASYSLTANASTTITVRFSPTSSGTFAGDITFSGGEGVTRTVTRIGIATSTLTVTKTGSGNGTVTSNPAGINCGSDCSEDYAGGTSVTLTANPAAGSVFAGFSGDSDCSDGVVTMNAAKTCTATFNIQQFTLTVNKVGSGSGTVTSNPAGINCGATCQASFSSSTSVTLLPLQHQAQLLSVLAVEAVLVPALVW